MSLVKRAARPRAALVLLVLVVVGGTGLAIWWYTRPIVMQPYYRFVEPQLRAGGQPAQAPFFTRPRFTNSASARQFYAAASIGDETRYLLSAPAKGILLYPQVVTVPPDGRLSYALKIPPQFGAAQRVVLTPSVKRGIKWSRLPSVAVPVQGAPGARTAQADLTLPPEDVGSTVKVRFDGTAITEGGATAWRSAGVRIPSGARLDFGIGILPAAWSQGPVEFTVKACAGKDCETLFSEALDPATPAGRRWQDRNVALGRLFWRTRMLAFETRCVGKEKDAFSFPVWANPTLSAPAVRGPEEANIILLSIDTLSAQHLTTYGYEHDTAPFIEETFGKQGTVADHCLTGATTTPGSHMTMFTSVNPCVHGVHDQQVLPAWLTTLAEALRAAGFETGAVTEDGWLGITAGFGRGFYTYAENKSPDVMTPEGQVELTFGKAKDWLARNRDKRFLLFLHTFQVHAPYTPPASYANLFGTHDGRPITDASPQALRDWANYDREIRYTDDQLRLLFDAIRANGLDGNTVFVIVGDHGEEFAEHGLVGHGADFYEEVTRVPLLFWAPGRIPAGKRITATVGLIDLMPTILDLAGVPKPSQAMGVSMLDLLRDRSVSRPGPSRPLFSESWVDMALLPDQSVVPVEHPSFMVQVGTHKLSRYRRNGGFTYELYDIAQDPWERTNRDRDAPNADLRAALDGYEDACKLVAAQLAAAGGHGSAQPPHQIQLDPAQEEKLRALGYLK